MALTTVGQEVGQSLKNPEVQKNLIVLGLGFLDSAPVTALSVAIVAMIQWNLEHISVEKTDIPIFTTEEFQQPIPGTNLMMTRTRQVQVGVQEGRRFRRLSTAETSILDNPNLTPLSPPLMSLATRLADAGADTAEAALALVRSQLETNRKSGLVGNIATFLFGE